MFPRLFSVTLFLALLLAVSTTLAAKTDNPAMSALKQAQGNLEQGKAMEAYKATDRAMFYLWDQVPFTLGVAVLTKGPNEGYGLFTPRQGNVYHEGQTLYVYLEPMGQRIKRIRDGLFAFSLSMDVALLKPDGTILWGKDKFQEWKFTSRRPNREFFINLRLKLRNVPDGQYLLSLRVHDRLSGRIAGRQLKVAFKKGAATGASKP
ncbi:MAG: hypothetical protein KQI62_05625 [Deltaproteobacteria bacterium]|nr:hypothetical protein [Deltaproteobacteria bacterium]